MNESSAIDGTLFLSFIKTLNLFVRVEPSFLVDHVYVLQPYLKGPPGELKADEEVLFYKLLANTLMEVVPAVKNPRKSFLNHTTADLMKLVTGSAKVRVVMAVIPCFCVITDQVTNDAKDLTEMVTRFYNFLKANRDKPDNSATGTGVRCLCALALFIKHFDFDAHCNDNDLNPLNLSKTGPTAMVEAVYRIYAMHFLAKHQMVKRLAVTGIIQLFSRCPDIIFKAENIIKRALSDAPDAGEESLSVAEQARKEKSRTDLQVSTLRDLKEFVTMEDANMQARQTRDSKSLKAKFNRQQSGEGGDSDEEDGAPGGWLSLQRQALDFLPGMIQMYEEHIHALCLHKQPEVRHGAICFMASILQQGVTNPVESIPFIVALTVDKLRAINGPAQEIIRRLDEKKTFRKFLRQRFFEGVKVSYNFQSYIYADFDPLHQIATVNQKKLQSRMENNRGYHCTRMEGIYQTYTMLTQTQSEAQQVYSLFVNELLSLSQQFESLRPLDLPATEEGSPSYQERISFMGYVAMVVATLPYEGDAPLQIIEKLSRFLNNQGQALLGALEKVFGDEDGDDMSKLLEKADSEAVRLQCEAAMAVTVLQATKLHLQQSFGLNESRFQEWRTNKKQAALSNRRWPRVEDPFFTLSQVPFWEQEKFEPPPKKTRGRGKKAKIEEEEINPAFAASYEQFKFFKALMDGDDLVLSVHKKEKKPPRKSRAKAKPKPKPKPKPKKKKRKRKGDSDDSDSDDEDYEAEDGASKGVRGPQRKGSRSRKKTNMKEESDEESE